MCRPCTRKSLSLNRGLTRALRFFRWMAQIRAPSTIWSKTPTKEKSKLGKPRRLRCRGRRSRRRDALELVPHYCGQRKGYSWEDMAVRPVSIFLYHVVQRRVTCASWSLCGRASLRPETLSHGWMDGCMDGCMYVCMYGNVM